MQLKLAYISLSALMIFLFLKIIYKSLAITYTDYKKKTQIIVIGLLLWQLFIFLISISGFTHSYEFPPRFALAFIIPSFIFTGIFLYKNRNSEWIHNISIQNLTYVQSFRILVELIFVYSVTEGVLHKEASIEGYNFDMIFAFTAIPIGLLIFRYNILNNKHLLYWNYLGLAVLASVIFVFMSSIYKPEIYGNSTPMLPMKAFEYPYVLVAAFLMPLAVFIHVLSIVKLKQRS